MAICDKCRGKVKSMLKKLDKMLTENVGVALEITTRLKNAVDSDIAVFLTTVIPGDWDDKLRMRAGVALTTALKVLQLIDGTRDVDVENGLNVLKSELPDMPKALQDAYYAKLASVMTRTLDNGRHTGNVYDSAVQLQYSLEYK